MVEARAYIYKMVDAIPDNDLLTIAEVLRHFVPPMEDSEWATIDDLAAHDKAIKELRTGEVVDLNDLMAKLGET